MELNYHPTLAVSFHPVTVKLDPANDETQIKGFCCCVYFWGGGYFLLILSCSHLVLVSKGALKQVWMWRSQMSVTVLFAPTQQQTAAENHCAPATSVQHIRIVLMLSAEVCELEGCQVLVGEHTVRFTDSNSFP